MNKQIQRQIQWENLRHRCSEEFTALKRDKLPADHRDCFNLIEELQSHIHSLSELNNLLQLSTENISASDLYDRVLEVILSFTRIGRDQKGLLFVMEEGGPALKAHRNIPPSLLKTCAKLRSKTCFCGQAAESKKPVFVGPDTKNRRHCINHLPNHSRYCIPILTREYRTIGVLTLLIDNGTGYSSIVEEILVTSSQVIADIMARKTMETDLQERTELLSSIYSAADSIGLVVTDLRENDALIVGFSPGAEQMFGYSEKEVLHRSISLLYREEDKHIIPGRVGLLRQGRKVTAMDMALKKKDGTVLPVVVTVNPFPNNHGDTTRALGVFNDISRLKETQLKLEQANTILEKRVDERTRELQLAQQQVLHAEKLAAVGQLSASIAHEFNSPLQGVMTVLMGVSRRAVLEDEDRRLVDSAVEECNRMAQLIRDLQDFNKPSTGRCSWINMHQVLDSLLLLYKSDFHSKKIDLRKDYAEELPAISVVSDQIRQVIMNLMNNAADACEPGGRITVSTRLVDDNIELIISDTGHGISPEHMQRIFEPFFTTKPAVKGTGLGLSVCYGIIKSHKGTIRVESLPDEGTRFIVTLPIKKLI